MVENRLPKRREWFPDDVDELLLTMGRFDRVFDIEMRAIPLGEVGSSTKMGGTRFQIVGFTADGDPIYGQAIRSVTTLNFEEYHKFLTALGYDLSEVTVEDLEGLDGPYIPSMAEQWYIDNYKLIPRGLPVEEAAQYARFYIHAARGSRASVPGVPRLYAEQWEKEHGAAWRAYNSLPEDAPAGRVKKQDNFFFPCGCVNRCRCNFEEVQSGSLA